MAKLPVGHHDDDDEDDADDDERDDADDDVEEHPPGLVLLRDDPVLGAAVGSEGAAALNVVVFHGAVGAGDVGLAHVGRLPLVPVPVRIKQS